MIYVKESKVKILSKLEKLIEELCFNGVEYKTIGEVANIVRGKVISKGYIKDNFGEYPVYSSQTENNGKLGCISTYDFNGEYLTWTTDGANAGTIFYRNGKFSITNVCGLIDVKSKKILVKFLYYFLSIVSKRYVNYGMGNPKLMSNVMSKILIPVPPLPVQEEIVRILDVFTELTEELTEELTSRNKQYEYYRNKLFSIIENVEYKTLDKVLKIKNGKDYKHLKSGNVPVYGSGGIMTYVDTAAYDKPSVLIPRKGSLDKLYYVNRPFWNVDTIFYTEINNRLILPKFVFYFLQTQHLEKLNNAGGVPSLTQSVLNKVKIPVPPLEEQQRIVDILDRFDKLCNDISEGLPAEIEVRQKQYKYYRDKLLTFKPLEEVK